MTASFDSVPPCVPPLTPNPVSAPPPASRAQAVLQGIADPALRQQVETTVAHARTALEALGQMHLPQDDFEAHTRGNADPNWHLALAPAALATLSAINHLLAYIMRTFDAPAELHQSQLQNDTLILEFNTVANVPGGAPTPSKDALTHEALRCAVPLSQAAQVAEVCHLLGAMLRDRVLAFADGLRKTAHLPDTWPLLAELDDTKRRLGKAVQGLMYGVYGVFSADIPREEIWPSYRSAVDEAVALRSALTDLAADMQRFSDAVLCAEPTQCLSLLMTMADHLAHFSTLAAYRGLRADDKKAVIDFRRTLLTFRHPASLPREGSRQALSHALADFRTFLGAMYAINHREVLVLHDRQGLESAAAGLQQLAEQVRLMPEHDSLERAQRRFDSIIQHLKPLYGRSSELDAVVTAHATQPAADTSEMLRRVTLLQDIISALLRPMA